MPMKESSEEGHIAVLVFPFGGHIEPLLNLVSRLANCASPNMSFSFFNSEKSNNSLFSEDSKCNNIPNNIKPYNVSDGLPNNYVLTGHPIEAVELFLKATPENYKTGIEKAVAETGKRISCFIADGFLEFAGEMADNFGVPWISLWIPIPCTLSAHIYTNLIRSKLCSDPTGRDNGNGNCTRANGHRVWLEDKAIELLPGLSSMRAADLPEEVLLCESLSQQTLLSQMLSRLWQLLPQMTALVLNSYQEINSTLLINDLKSKVPKLLSVGFLTVSLPAVPILAPSSTDATGCLSWLDAQRASSVVYISFGTIGAPPHDELITLAEALEASGVPFLWSLKENLKVLLPYGFVERITENKKGKIVPWAPQAQVLYHASTCLFITHGGTNSVYESIANEVPMICRPLFGDQRMNAWMVEDVWGIGVKIEGGVLTRNGVLKSLELILSNEQGKKMRENIRALRDIVQEAAGPFGSAIRDFRTLVDIISTHKGKLDNS